MPEQDRRRSGSSSSRGSSPGKPSRSPGAGRAASRGAATPSAASGPAASGPPTAGPTASGPTASGAGRPSAGKSPGQAGKGAGQAGKRAGQATRNAGRAETGPGRAGKTRSRAAARSDFPEPGDEVPIRAGAPRIRLDGLPSTLRWAIWVLVAEGVGLLGVAVFLVVDAVTGPAQSPVSATALIAFTLVMAGVLVGCGRALAHRAAWARSPAIVIQLLLVPIGWSMISVGLVAPGIGLIVIGLGGAATLLAPATRAALGAR